MFFSFFLRNLADVLRKEHTLRQMNSFDSGLTARANDTKPSEDVTVNLRGISNFPLEYQPEIFEVLQKLTGIRSRAPSASTDPSPLSSEVSPEDDPRFVLWGTRIQTSEATLADPRLPPARERMLIAASIERWIAQLTSALDYDELLNFYLTFRKFISAVDLCRLLICRFQWSLDRVNSTVDASVRKIVRLRTFVAIKYWLQTFFAVDFLPNRDLRMLFADWLNTAVCDRNLGESPDALVCNEFTARCFADFLSEYHR
jgi:hypothetical protein